VRREDDTSPLVLELFNAFIYVNLLVGNNASFFQGIKKICDIQVAILIDQLAIDVDAFVAIGC
jgi:hypothetical protein